MRIEIYKSLWGMQGDLENQIAGISSAGYDGIEAGLPAGEALDRLLTLLARRRLRLIAWIETTGTGVDDHIESFRCQAEQAASVRPVLINSHSAADRLTFAEQITFFQHALDIETRLGIPVAHETHRGRPTYTPWNTAALLQALPDLKLTMDVSHWICVCERLPDDCLSELLLAASKTLHLHARVGYEQGPQVPDPRAPEYARQVAWHERYWRDIVQARQTSGHEVLTVTPEYGPPGYLHTLPGTRQPVADLWDVCLWAAERARSQWTSEKG